MVEIPYTVALINGAIGKELGVSVEDLVAIDMHVHAMVAAQGKHASNLSAAASAYFGTEGYLPAPDEIAAYYRERRMRCVLFGVDHELASGEAPIPNEAVAEAAQRHPDVITPFASIDPHRGVPGIRAARRLIEDHGVRGFKFHPNQQQFFPNDRLAYPLYELIESYQLPALFHTGHTGIGANMPGGGGIRLKYSNPMAVDDVAVDFPDLPIVLAHPSFPWQDEAISVALHKPTVHIDLSGWSPKYFPAQLVQYANTLLRHKVLFGSDYPLITPDRWLADFEQLAVKEEVRPLILRDNAARLLRLS
jgi:predicted TIM-barrel fold metal-dependent hydrolase